MVAGYVYAPDAELDSVEIKLIEAVCRDLWVAWYTGDADLLRRCVHPDADGQGLVRRVIDTRTEFVSMNSVPRSELLAMTNAGVGLAAPEDRLIEVTVLAATHYVASAQTVSRGRRTHLFHLMRFPEGWRIVQAIWANDGGIIPRLTSDI